MHTRKHFLSCLVMLLFGVCAQVLATDCTWDHSSGNNWNNSANWSCGSVPDTTGENAIFDGTSSVNCTLDTDNLTIGSLSLNSGFTGTLDLGSNNLTAGTNFTLAAGTFKSSSNTFDVDDVFTVTGGTFTHNNGKVVLSSSSDETITPNNITLYDLEINFNDIKNCLFAGTATVSNDLTLTDGHLDGGTGGNLLVQGNIICDAAFGANTNKNDCLVTLANSTDQTLQGTGGAAGGIMPSLIVDKSSGAFILGSNMSFYRFTYTTAGSVSIGTNKVTLDSTDDGDFKPGGITLYDLDISYGDIKNCRIVGAVTVSNELTLTDGRLDQGTSGNLQVQGNITCTSAFGVNNNKNDGLITMIGGNDSTISFTDGGIMPKFTINKDASTDLVLITGTGTLTFYEDVTLTQGILDLNGLNLECLGTSSYSCENNATLRLEGDEAVTFGVSFDTNSGTVEFDGTGSYTADPTGFGGNFYNLTFSAGTWNLSDTIHNGGTGGSNIDVTNALKINNTPFTGTGAITSSASGVTTIGSSGAQTITLSNATSIFQDLIIAGSDGRTVTMDVDTQTLTISGDLDFDNAVTLAMNASSTLTVTGTLKTDATNVKAGARASISTSSGFVTVNLNGGLNATEPDYFVFQNISTSGVTLNLGASRTWDNVSFLNLAGNQGASAYYLNITPTTGAPILSMTNAWFLNKVNGVQSYSDPDGTNNPGTVNAGQDVAGKVTVTTYAHTGKYVGGNVTDADP